MPRTRKHFLQCEGINLEEVQIKKKLKARRTKLRFKIAKIAKASHTRITQILAVKDELMNTGYGRLAKDLNAY